MRSNRNDKWGIVVVINVANHKYENEKSLLWLIVQIIIIKMSDYWTGLVNYKQGKEHKYFRAQLDDNGEAIESTICEINFIEERNRIKEQIQEDIICFIDSLVPQSTDEYRKDNLCKIVVDNFKGFE